MDRRELVRRWPILYHMAEAGSWPSIRQHGLLCTTALLDLFEVDATRRHRLETEWRPKSEEISHPIHGTAVIRDQIPMPPAVLQQFLEPGLTTADWVPAHQRQDLFLAERHPAGLDARSPALP